MEIDTYNLIWKNSIFPKVQKVLDYQKDVYYVGDHVKDKIWLSYEEIKNKVHTYMYNPNGRIDRHKIAAALTSAILNNKPFDIVLRNNDQEVSSQAILANEILAFNSALAVVFCFIIQKAKDDNDNISLKIFEKGFIFPKCEHGEYETHIFKMLYYSKYNQKFDFFTFSNLLFMIEEYTKVVKKTEKLALVN